MKARKVVHVTSVHVWSDTRIFQRMCQGLSRRHWEVCLVAPNVPSQVIEGVRIIGVPIPKSRLLRAVFGGYRAIMAARSIPADIYHIHDPELLFWKWLLRSRRRPVVYDMHEYVSGAIRARPWISPAVRKPLAVMWNAFERLALHRSPVVLAERSYLTHYRWLPQPAVVLNLPDTEALLGIPEQEKVPRVVYVGRVSRTRGSVRMIEALLLLRKRGLRIGLDIVGPISDEHKRELELIIAEHAIPEVQLHGYMKPVPAWRLAKRAVCGLAVLDPVPNYVGSFPTKMFEYMALALPVIVSNFPLYREVVEGSNCGICVEPLNPHALANAIERLAKDPILAHNLGENGRRAVVASYRWDQQLDILEKFYATTLRVSSEFATQ